MMFIPLSSSGEQKDLQNNKVAIVNGNIITQDHFNRELTRFKQELTAAGRAFDDSNLPLIKKQVIENIIGAELLYLDSQKSGITVAENEINEGWEQIKKQFSGEDEMRDALTKMQLSETVIKNQIKQGLAIQKLIDNKFAKNIYPRC